MLKNTRCDNDKNTWILDIPCSILDIQLLSIFYISTHLNSKENKLSSCLCAFVVSNY